MRALSVPASAPANRCRPSSSWPEGRRPSSRDRGYFRRAAGGGKRNRITVGTYPHYVDWLLRLLPSYCDAAAGLASPHQAKSPTFYSQLRTRPPTSSPSPPPKPPEQSAPTHAPQHKAPNYSRIHIRIRTRTGYPRDRRTPGLGQISPPFAPLQSPCWSLPSPEAAHPLVQLELLHACRPIVRTEQEAPCRYSGCTCPDHHGVSSDQLAVEIEVSPVRFLQ